MTSPVSTDLGSDIPAEEFRAHAHEVADWIADYLEGVGSLPVLPSVQPGDIRSVLPVNPPMQGESLNDALSDFRDVIVPGLTHWNHPSFFGYFAMTGSGPGILGEMLAAALNVNAMVWRSSPSGTELEELTADWLRQATRAALFIRWNHQRYSFFFLSARTCSCPRGSVSRGAE
ncbi:MAG: hypothetical protein CM1200mP14_10510 [Gammaproteobacteria bacterium]|nr:MAG: hypothetical protein CM1200mP14_10510 [Gammaproteobacteria bacterium]